jgi:hypothetical protein
MKNYHIGHFKIGEEYLAFVKVGKRYWYHMKNIHLCMACGLNAENLKISILVCKGIPVKDVHAVVSLHLYLNNIDSNDL